MDLNGCVGLTIVKVHETNYSPILELSDGTFIESFMPDYDECSIHRVSIEEVQWMLRK